jgi:hypothetical protein
MVAVAVLESAPRPRKTAMASLKLLPLTFVALLAAAATAHATDLYQWKDAKGVTHYTDAPPPKGQYQARSLVTPEGTAPAPQAPAAAPKKTTADGNCTLARANLDRLQAGGTVGPDNDGDGKPDTTFSAEQTVQQKQLAESDIKRWCTAATAAPTP